MELHLHALGKDTKLLPADYYFTKYKEYLDIKPYLVPKIKGVWQLCLVDLKVSEIESIIDEKLSDAYSLLVYLPANSLDSFVQNHPELAARKETFKEAITNYIATYKHEVKPDVIPEMIKRLGHKSKLIIQFLDVMQFRLEEDEPLTIKHVRKWVPKQSPIYASNVAEAFLLKRKSRWWLVEKYEQEVGPRIAYYAVRKYIRKLFEDKCCYLRNEEIKNFLASKVDTYSIIAFYYCFTLYDKPSQLWLVLDCFEKRRFANAVLQ